MQLSLKAGDDVIRRTADGLVRPAKMRSLHENGTHARVLFTGAAVWEEDVPLDELRRPWEVRLYGSGTINVVDGHDPNAPYLYTIIRSEARDDVCQRIRHDLAVTVCAWFNGMGPYPAILKGEAKRPCGCAKDKRPGMARTAIPMDQRVRGGPVWEWAQCSECKGTAAVKLVRRISEETIIVDIPPGTRFGEFSFGTHKAEFHLSAAGPMFDANPPRCDWKTDMSPSAKDARARLVDLLWITPLRSKT